MVKDFFRHIREYDLSNFVFKNEEDFHPSSWKYVNLSPGKEPYKLYQCIAENCPHTILCEFGVLYGASLTIFLSNKSKLCCAFDIEDQRYGSCKEAVNVWFHLCDAIEALDVFRAQIESSQLIHLDTVHDGKHEQEFYNKLKRMNFRGAVLIDDIHLNDAMTSFFNNVKEEKYDLTDIGHCTGTGVVLLGED